MTLMSIGKLNELLGAVGFDVAGKGVDYTEYFGDSGATNGGQCYANFKDYRDKEGVQRQDITNYISVADGDTGGAL